MTAGEGETLARPDAERVAADELRRLLAGVRAQAEYPLMMVTYPRDDGLDATNAYESREEMERLLAESNRNLRHVLMNPRPRVEVVPSPFPPAMEAALAFLGLHPQERAFIRALAENRLDDVAAGAFADWLEENGRTAEGERVRLLRPKPGDVVAYFMDNADFPRHRRASLAERLRELLPNNLWLLIPPGGDVAHMPPEMMRQAGWVRAEEVAAEREACARLVEQNPMGYSGNDVWGSDEIARRIRERGEAKP